MIFQKCTKADLAQVQAIARETFIDTFSKLNTQQNMESYLNLAFSKEVLARELGKTSSAFYLALQEKEIIGYLKVNEAPAQTELNDPFSLELARIYLTKKNRNKGLGRYLLQQAIGLATEKEKKYLWLGVWEKNQAALNFYRKHSFYEFAQHDFWMGKDKQRDVLMRLDLNL